MARQRHDRSRMEALLARRERRGLTYSQLAAESGVPVTTLSWWASRLRRDQATGQGFVELGPTSASTSTEAHVEIALRSGRQLVVREAIAPATLSALVAALEG